MFSLEVCHHVTCRFVTLLLVGLSPCYWRGEERILQANHKRWGVQAGDDDKVVKNGGKFVKIGEKFVENLSKFVKICHNTSSCHVIMSIFRCHPRFVRRRRCLFARSKMSKCQKRLNSTIHDHCQHNHPHSSVSLTTQISRWKLFIHNPIHHNHIVTKLIITMLMKIHRRFAQKCQRMFAKKGSRKNAGQPNATTV